MNELAQASKIFSGSMGLHLDKYPSGKWGFIGSVPAVLAYIHEDGSCPTDSEIRDIKQSCCPTMTCKTYGITTRTFDTEQQARFAAARAGFEVRQ